MENTDYKPRILLVEDEPMNMAILSGYLRENNYIVDEAADGQEALKMLLSEPQAFYDIVITDRRMPNMDGLELSLKMKETPSLKNIPVIMQTAATALSEVTEGIRAGVYYYLTKPFEEETLLTLLRAATRDREKSKAFEQRLARQKDAISTLMEGIFHVRQPKEAENVAILLGSLFPRPELAITGLYELLMNGIEHGNLKIGFDEKRKLLTTATLEKEIDDRLLQPANTSKKLRIEFSREDGNVNVAITDDGEGFDWRPFMEIEPARAMQGNGRGIAKANQISFDRLSYIGKGNRVEVSAKSAT